MGKPEWQKSKYKTGMLIFKCLAKGPDYPPGHSVKATITNGFTTSTQNLTFNESVSYLPKNDNVTIKFKSKSLPNYKEAVMKFPGNAKHYLDFTWYIVEF